MQQRAAQTLMVFLTTVVLATLHGVAHGRIASSLVNSHFSTFAEGRMVSFSGSALCSRAHGRLSLSEVMFQSKSEQCADCLATSCLPLAASTQS